MQYIFIAIWCFKLMLLYNSVKFKSYVNYVRAITDNNTNALCKI